MQKLTREKQYKARTPLETVDIIRDILKKSGFDIAEELHSGKEVGVHSCRITIANDGLSELKIGTNGKGMTTEYSLASGYAEFMERLQNGRLINISPSPQAAAHTVPVRECSKVIKEFFKENYGENEKASKNVLSAFDSFRLADFSTFDGSEKVSIPIDVLFDFSTSNGMCAGNTYTEAVIQGTSELFERYAEKEIIYKKLCPPVIPEDYFKGHDIYEKLQLLKEKNVYYEVRDCSLGIGLPVIGLYLRLDDNREFFHLGSDPSPVTSLERTITEIFQGLDSIKEVSFYEPVNEDHDEAFWKYQLELSSWGANVYPKELREDNYSWAFEGFDHPLSSSDEDDMKYYLDILDSLGKKLYIRDVSFLGFPSYYCYIPGFNFVRFCCDSGEELSEYLVQREEIRKLVSIPDLDKRQRKKLANLLISFSDEFWYMWAEKIKTVFFPRGLFPYDFSLPIYIISKLYASCGLNNLAAEEMEDYIISNRLSRKAEERLTDFVMYMRTGEHEFEETPEMCKWTFGDSIGCQNCESCCAKTFCRRSAADSIIGRLYP